MNSTESPEQQGQTRDEPSRLRIRYPRLALAVAGLVGLLTLVVTGVLAPFGVVSGLWPLIAALAFVGSVVALRALAIGDRRRRVIERINRTYAEAVAATAVREQAHHGSSEVFDAQPGSGESERALSVEELRAEARRVAAAQAATKPVSSTHALDTSRQWQPVAVPKPTYVDAAKAERPQPEPLPVPQSKKPERVKSILADTRSGESHSALSAPSAEPAPARESAQRINLDDVLQRRRGA
ncbi:hypothetical protein [Zhihengliuella flava]|uniref:Uncharacterized protein n=1 Tax=Zhihengliuella flava TaxID=1285193 RepID=A0A931GG76_9MICC|nr:hypothetical protein [Zhihengliuella flava]MBG6085487.1 hypothetical protein [Zhihengliuella flava]